jgi:hypothetical protein
LYVVRKTDVYALFRDADETCALLGYFAAYSGNSLPTFRDNLSVPSSNVNKSKSLYAV